MSKTRFIKSVVICVVTALILSLLGISEIIAREDIPFVTESAADHAGPKEAGEAVDPATREANAGLPIGFDQESQALTEASDSIKNLPERSSTPVPGAVMGAAKPNPGLPSSEPAPEAAVNAPAPSKSEPPPPPAAPVSFSWGAAHTYHYRTEILLTNSGGEVSQGVLVSLPLLENSSPYQTTSLNAANYEAVGTSGRTSSFHIGEMQPGETKTLIVDYSITVRPVWLNSTNATVEKARQAYREYAGSSNCFVLATGFVNRSRELGLTARVVNGLANPQRGIFAPGYLHDRHSWAEFYVDGLGWVPVDLTFQYFGQLPQASHIVENYADQSLKLNYLGGKVNAAWHTRIL